MFKRKGKGSALSVRHRRTLESRGCLSLFFGIFFAAGAAMLYFFAVRPLLGVYLAQSWVAAPCVIISSEVGVHDGEDGDTYSIDITYDYTFGERRYRGDRYHFMHGFSSSGRRGKQAVVDRYPPGLETVCYVDPGDPTQAVLHRGLTADMWWGLFPLPFLGVGLGGLLFVFGAFGTRRKTTAEFPDRQVALSAHANSLRDAWEDEDPRGSDGPVTLKPRYSPLGKFIAVTCIALFWNGLVSVFVYKAVESHLSGHPEWCLTFFIIPFVLVGLLLIWGIFYSFVALFSPRPTLTLDHARIPLGGTARLSWRFAGNPSTIRQLRVTLLGEEHATYRRGTDTHTDKQRFFKEVLYETCDPLEIPEGDAEIRIPDDAMHSFESGNNKITWEVHLDGEIPLRPDVDAEFPITVVPHQPHRADPDRAGDEFPAATPLSSGATALSLSTVDGRTAFFPGERIDVDLNWNLDEPPEALELRLVWNTAGKGTTDLEVVYTERIDHPLAIDSHRVSLTLPLAPFSFSGRLVSLIWALELIALPSEESARLEITIGPGAQEVVLAPSTQDRST